MRAATAAVRALRNPQAGLTVASPKANWFVDDLAGEDHADPFMPIEEVGTPIDLRSEPELHLRLIDLLRTAGELDAQGVRCEIRERNDSVCAACPLSQANRPGAAGDLCRNGVEIERVLTTIQIIKVNARAKG